MALKVLYLDASVLVMHIDLEPGRQELGRHLDTTMPWHTTSLCITEALGVFKRKYLNKAPIRYLAKCQHLLSLLKSDRPRVHVDKTQLADTETFYRAWEYSEKYKIDLSDALQL